MRDPDNVADYTIYVCDFPSLTMETGVSGNTVQADART